jgi:pyruvyl transferase EpsO
MIWLGERSYLDSIGVSIVYTCDHSNYSQGELTTRLKDGIILIHGGGNLGDLYPHHHSLREAVVKAFPQNKIIQLPQSIFFKDKTNLERAANVFDAHPDFTLLVREKQSFEFARNEFHARCILCPDSAFILGALDRPRISLLSSLFASSRKEILWLARTDSESRGGPFPPIGANVERTDWLEEAKLIVESSRSTLEAYDFLAKKRLVRGSRILSRGNIVITDRLHGHILSLLLGIPCIILDNSYGKMKSFYETWTRDFPSVHWANSPKDALGLARSYLKALRNRIVS